MTDFRVLVFAYMVANIFTLYLGLKLLGIDIEWKKIVLVGVIISFVDFFARPLMSNIGLPDVAEMPFSLVIEWVMVRYFLKISWGVAILSLLLGTVVTAIGQALMFILLKAFNIDLAALVSGAWWRIVLYGNLSYITSYIMVIWLIIKPFHIIDFSKKKGTFI